MNPILTLTQKELKSSFRSAAAYVFLASFLILTHWVFFRTFFINGQASLRSYFQFAPWALLFFIAAISMGKWSDEKRQGTHEILLTLPLSENSLILAKFLSGALFLLLSLILSLPLLFTCSFLGKLDWGQSLAMYLGLYLLSLSFLSWGLLCSALSKNSMVSFILCAMAAFFFYILGDPFILSSAPPMLISTLSSISLQTHYANLARGVLSLKSLIYFLSFIFSALLLNRFVVGNLKKKSSLVLTVLILAIVVTFNLIASKSSLRFDFTQEKRYSLSSSTEKILKNLNDKVVLKLYLSKELPPALTQVREDIWNTLSEYQNLSGHKISIQEMDPATDPEEEKKINQLGIPPVQLSVIEKDTRALKKIYLGLGIFYEDKKEMFPVLSEASNLEYQLSSALLKLTSKKLKKIGIVVDDKDLFAKQYAILKESLEKTYELQLLISNQDWDLKNFSSLLLLSPQGLNEKNISSLEEYYHQGGHLIALVNRVEVNTELETRKTPSNLFELLSKLGIQINEDLVLDASNAPAAFASGNMQYQIAYPFWVKVTPENLDKKNPITANLQSLVLPWTSSLQGGSQVLAKSSLESSLQKSPFILQPQAVAQIPLQAQNNNTLIALLQKENASLLVVGSSRFMEDDFLRMFEDNLNFFLNAVDWMSLGEDLIHIRAKTLVDRPLKLLSENEKNWIKVLNTYGMAFVVIVLGLFYNYRRNKSLQNLSQQI
ncbi:MAG: Gldg family protein [Deltaproteobacteria bacterium]|nr:Gldg family protein [Deltaproteobacteria bacterium]